LGIGKLKEIKHNSNWHDLNSVSYYTLGMSTTPSDDEQPSQLNPVEESKQSTPTNHAGSTPHGKFASANPYEAFLLAEEQDGAMDIDQPSALAKPAGSVQPSNLPDVLQLLDNARITTCFLLVSFLPDWINYVTFCTVMDLVLRKIYSEDQLSRHKIASYRKEDFATFFGMKPPLWMILHFPKEQHGSYLLKLPTDLSFGPMGSFGGMVLPRIFSIPLPSRKRNCVIQAVPPDFRTIFLQRPELAYWRGLGPTITSGLNSLALTLVDHRIDMAFKKLIMEGDLPDDVRHFSFVMLRYVNIQDTSSGKRSKQRDNTTPDGGSRHSWQECFIVTMSTAALHRQELCFQSLLAGDAPRNTLMGAVNLFGWRGEVASDFTLFSTWEFSPDASLLVNQPVTIFPGLKSGHTVRELCGMLEAEGQTLAGILFGYVERGPRDTLVLATDGRKLIATPALLLISNERAFAETDLPGMGQQRLNYLHFRQLTRVPPTKLTGLLTVAQRKKEQLNAVVKGQTYAAAAKTPPVHPDQLVKNYLRHEVNTLLQDARNEVKQDVRDLQAQLEKANAKIMELETTADKALKAGQGAVKLIGTQHTDAQAQREKDMAFFKLLYDTMQESGMELPPEAAAYLKIGNKRRTPAPAEDPTMEMSHG